MLTQREVFGTIEDTLKGIDGIDERVYTGPVPDPLPSDSAGRPLPGVRLHLRVPHPVDDLPVSDEQLLDARQYRVQTTVWAADPYVLMDATDAIIQALTGLRIHGGALHHATENEPTDPYLWDTTLDPHRPYAPLYWRIETQ